MMMINKVNTMTTKLFAYVVKKLATLSGIHCLSFVCRVYKSSILMMLVQSELLRLICCKNEWP